MKLAFLEARKGQNTWTNPRVGAVLVKNNQVLSQGHHETFGEAHAEVNALKKLNDITKARGATLYVTLEPCSHFGKTPPCVQKIVEMGIKKVVIGQVDPNPIVSGRGIKYLRDHDVIVENLEASTNLNTAYNFFYKNKRPLITVKYAMTLDGKINQDKKVRSLISNQKAYEDSQQLRSQNQVILIGENTLKIDNPRLTVRSQNLMFPPIRAVMVRDINIVDLNSHLFQSQEPIWLFSATKNQHKLPKNVQIFVGEWNPQKVIKLFAKKGLESVLIEGGSHLQADFVEQGLVDKVVVYLANKVFGRGLPAIWDKKIPSMQFSDLDVEKLDSNLKITTWRIG